MNLPIFQNCNSKNQVNFSKNEFGFKISNLENNFIIDSLLITKN